MESGGGGLFGGLGTMFGLAGAMMGAPTLGMVGTGMNAIDAISSGNAAGAAGAIMGMRNGGAGMFGDWMNPGQGNLYLPGGAEAEALWTPAYKKALAAKGVEGF
jgi:hypothetical protein